MLWGGGGGGLLPEDFRAIARTFKKLRKLNTLYPNTDITCILNFHLDMYAAFHNRCRFSMLNKISSRQIENCFSKTIGGA